MKNELKKFGLTMAACFVVLAIIFRLKHHLFVGLIFSLAGFIFAFLSLVRSQLLKPIRSVWLKFSYVLGFVMSKIILAIVFFLVVFPVGFVARIFGKKFLDLKTNKTQKSYWQVNPGPTENITPNFYERQF